MLFKKRVNKCSNYYLYNLSVVINCSLVFVVHGKSALGRFIDPNALINQAVILLTERGRAGKRYIDREKEKEREKKEERERKREREKKETKKGREKEREWGRERRKEKEREKEKEKVREKER